MRDREDYLAEGYKQLSDTSPYVQVKKHNHKLPWQHQKKSNTFLNDYRTTS